MGLYEGKLCRTRGCLAACQPDDGEIHYWMTEISLIIY